MLKIAFIAEGYGPYRVPFWNELGRRVDLSVLLLGKVETGRDWNVRLDEIKVNLIILDAPQLALRSIEWVAYMSYSKIQSVLARLAPDAVIIGGWASPGYWAAWSWALKNRVPLVFWSESHRLSTRTHGWRLLNAIKKYFLKSFDCYYAFSPLSAEYLFAFGVDPRAVVLSYNLPNIQAFARYEGVGEASEPTLLYVGQLIKRKGLLELFNALGRLTQRSWRLMIAGTGSLQPELRRRASLHGFADRVEFLGYIQQDALNEVYRRGDILLFPSLNEVWGLVLHEALLSGLYAVASDRAAASHALLRPGENGELVSPNDINALAAAIGRALDHYPFDRRKIRRTVSHITIEGEVSKLVDAVRFAQAHHTRA